MENLRLKKFGFNTSKLSADLLYYNPNKTRLKLKEATGDAWVDDVHLGHFIVDTLVDIPAKGDFVLPVKMDAELGKILKSTVGAIFKKDVTVRIEGTARLGKGPVFINVPIRYKGKHRFEELFGNENVQ